MVCLQVLKCAVLIRGLSDALMSVFMFVCGTCIVFTFSDSHTYFCFLFYYYYFLSQHNVVEYHYRVHTPCGLLLLHYAVLYVCVLIVYVAC